MEDIFNVYEKAVAINVYTVGDKKTYQSGTKEFRDILKCWNEMLENAYDMPAYGVSLHKQTLEEMKSGRWIEFDFGKQLEYNGMPFEKLLVQVESVYQGFNLIRYNKKGGYDGRCFYINLVGKDMSKLCEFLALLGQKPAN